MDVSALIPTYNASKSIIRAINSALSEVDEIIVVDDGSSDDTLAKIRALNEPKIRVFACDENKGVWHARILCLDHCRTPYAAWLDSDDEFLPGRIETLRSVLVEGGYGWVYDNMEFYDGSTLGQVGRTHYPEKLNEGDNIYFQFARNYIRGACQALIDVEAAREIGYNPLINDSDYDHMLRAILKGKKRVYFHSSMTYRYYITEGSVSSYKQRQIEATKWILNNIGFEALQERLSRTSLDTTEKLTIGLYFLANIGKWEALEELVSSHLKLGFDLDWLCYFMLGVAAYKLGQYSKSMLLFEHACAISRKPECLNNLAVLEAHFDKPYKNLLKTALNLFPDYTDARKNLDDGPEYITIVPLRVEAELPWNKPELAKKYSVL